MARSVMPMPQISLGLQTPRGDFEFDFDCSGSGRQQTNQRTSPCSTEWESLKGLDPRREYIQLDLDSSLSPVDSKPSGHDETTSPLRQSSLRQVWRRLHPNRKSKERSSDSLSTSESNTTTTSEVSTPSLSPSISVTSLTTSQSADVPSEQDQKTPLESLPSSILDIILAYVLELPSTVLIGPYLFDSYSHHPRFGSSRSITVPRILEHALFAVSHSIRNAARELFFSKTIIIINLANIYNSTVSSAIRDNIKTHVQFWISTPPEWIRLSLQQASKLAIRLPVPSTDATTRYGRDEQDWMDGSDGRGGGSYRIKTVKEEEEDAVAVRKCLLAITKLIRAPELAKPKVTRSVSSLSLHRTKSISSRSNRSLRRRKSENCEEAAPDVNQRHALRLLEVTLVKRNASTVILHSSIALIHAFKDVSVDGRTRINIELEGQSCVWATKKRKRWEGLMLGQEPDGAKLLRDLQSLTISHPRITEPIQTPTAFEFISLDANGRLSILPTVLQGNDISMEDEIVPITPGPRTAFRLPAHGKPRIDSFMFVMEKGISDLVV